MEWQTMLILFISSNVLSFRQEALLYIFEDSDQDDHKGKKSYHETCFQNPQTYSEWVIQK